MPTKHHWPAVKFVLEALFDQQAAEWKTWEEKESSKPNLERHSAILAKTTIVHWRWSEITKSKLENLLAKEQLIKFSDEQLFFFLPPFPKEAREFVPVISIEYQPARDCLNLRVGMYRLDEQAKPCGYGFRLESPTTKCTGKDPVSVHDYYHVQMIADIGCGPSFGLPDWLPLVQPAICIRADNPVDAILNLILSLYGLDFFKEFLKPLKSRILTNIDLMRTISD